jgi:hypothetical protein
LLTLAEAQGIASRKMRAVCQKMPLVVQPLATHPYRAICAVAATALPKAPDRSL